MNTIIAEVVEDQVHSYDVYHKLLDSRVIFVSEPIHDQAASDICATILAKHAEGNEKISLFLNVAGGDTQSILSIYDVMMTVQKNKTPIETVCMGSVMDASVILLAAGTRGMRHATKHAVIAPSELQAEHFIHSNLTDAKTLLKELQNDNKKIMQILAKHTKKTAAKISKDFKDIKYLTSKEAQNYGIIDKVI